MVKDGHVVMDDSLFGFGVWCYPFHQASFLMMLR